VHVDGAISSNHPLDVYFLETIRTRREEKARVAREGQEAIKRAQREAIERIIKVPFPFQCLIHIHRYLAEYKNTFKLCYTST
jgi:hypothetical protein